MSLNGTVRICERMCKGIQKTWLTGFIISIVGHQVDILIRFYLQEEFEVKLKRFERRLEDEREVERKKFQQELDRLCRQGYEED